MTIFTFYARNSKGEARVCGTLDIEKQEYRGPEADSCRATIESIKTVNTRPFDPRSEEDLIELFGRGSRFWIRKGEPHKTGRPLKKGELDIPAVEKTPAKRSSRSDERDRS